MWYVHIHLITFKGPIKSNIGVNTYWSGAIASSTQCSYDVCFCINKSRGQVQPDRKMFMFLSLTIDLDSTLHYFVMFLYYTVHPETSLFRVFLLQIVVTPSGTNGHVLTKMTRMWLQINVVNLYCKTIIITVRFNIKFKKIKFIVVFKELILYSHSGTVWLKQHPIITSFIII